MKKKIASLIVLAAFVTTGIFATPVDDNLSTHVLSSFSQRFHGAKEVNWSKTEHYVKASFQMNEQSMFAYFTFNGELLGVSKNLLSTQLPINLQTELKKIAANNWISELFEMGTAEQTNYYTTIENADQKVFLKSEDNKWTVIKKVKKD